MAGYQPGSPQALAYLNQQLVRRGVDPRAADAVFHMEGASGGIGDGGHAFGPGQFNDAGGVWTGRYGNLTPQQKNLLAWSPQGLNELAQRVGTVASGQKGAAAVRAIVQRFERPAAPGREIAGALARYSGSLGPGVAGTVASSLGANGAALGGATGNDPGAARRTALLNQIFQRDQAYTGMDSTQAFQTYAASAPVQMQTPRGNVPVSGQQIAGTQHDPHGIVATAEKWLGTPYSWGGGGVSGPSKGIAQGANTVGFDCSSFVQYLWGQQGVNIPRTTYQQWKAGSPVNPNALKPGDAVYFDMTSAGPGHVGMYIGGGKYIEAPHTGGHIQISNLNGASGFVGARRF